jgi:hypothetical protein
MTMTEAWVDERGCLHVPSTPHTCESYHDRQNHPCRACDETRAFWASFEDDYAVPVPRPETWDEKRDASLEGQGDEDAPEVL